MPNPPDEGTIIIKGGGQNYLAGTCPPVDITIVIGPHKKTKGSKSKGAKGAKPAGKRKKKNG